MSDFRLIFLDRPRRPTASMLVAWVLFVLFMVALGYVWASGGVLW